VCRKSKPPFEPVRDPGRLADMIASHIELSIPDKQALLATLDPGSAKGQGRPWPTGGWHSPSVPGPEVLNFAHSRENLPVFSIMKGGYSAAVFYCFRLGAITSGAICDYESSRSKGRAPHKDGIASRKRSRGDKVSQRVRNRACAGLGCQTQTSVSRLPPAALMTASRFSHR
jgi:hypothetical protein